VKSFTESGLGLEIPFYRTDVQREVDVIEEILRVYGYNNVVFGNKLNASVASTSKFDDHRLQHLIGNLLAGNGFYEIVNNSLSNPDYSRLLGTERNSEIAVLNPLSNDLSVLRQSMLSGGLEAISHNINRRKQHLRFFEFGKTYKTSGTNYLEAQHLSLLVTGDRHSESWATAKKNFDFYYLKGIVRIILERLGVTDITSGPSANIYLSEGLALHSAKKELVTFGVVQKAILHEFDIKQEVLYADFNWDLLVEIAGKNTIVHSEIPKYPEVKRDFALLLDDKITFEQIRDIAMQTEKKLLKNVNLFDVYEGGNLPSGKKSYAVSYTLQDDTKTLTDKQIDKIMKKLQARYERELGAVLR
jgi:phenylalanyl-tRNA synthetase beta chain